MIYSSDFGINIDQEFQSGLSGWGDPSFSNDDWTKYYPTSQVQGDLDYLWSLGFRRVRVAAGDIVNSTQAFRDTRFAVHLQTCKLASAMGFHVEFGAIPASIMHMSSWANFLSVHLSYALQFQSVINQYGNEGVWMVGNENESNSSLTSAGSRDIITSMSRTSNIVTVIMPTTHSLQTNDVVRYFNASSGNGSGTTMGITSNTNKTVTRIDDYTFSFGSAGSDDTSTIGWICYDQTTIRNQMKRLATSNISGGLTVPQSYSCVQGPDFNNQLNIHNFGLSGRGDLTYVDLNCYGQFTDHYARFLDFMNEINSGVSSFGTTHFRVTEWHVSTNNSGIPTDMDEAKKYLHARLNYLRGQGLKHFLFCYREPNNLLIMKRPYNTNINSYNKDYWWDLTSQRSPTIEVTSSTVIGVSEYKTQNGNFTNDWSGLAMNYGQDTQGSTYNTAQVTTDLTRIWGMGVRKIRIAMSSYNSSTGVANSKTLALAAKSVGFYVVWGVTVLSGFSNTTDANWATYTAAVNDAADWAWSNGIDEFQVGNEIEYSETVSHTLTDSVSKIKAMATDVKTNHFMADGVTRFMSYAMGQSAMDYVGAPGGWIATGKGDLTLLGYNVYGDSASLDVNRAQFEQRITDLYNTFGSNLYVSEWNIGDGIQFPSTEAAQATEIGIRKAFLKNLGIQTAYFFTYRWDSGNASNQLHFPLKVSNYYRQWLYSLFTTVINERQLTNSRILTIGRPLI